MKDKVDDLRRLVATPRPLEVYLVAFCCSIGKKGINHQGPKKRWVFIAICLL